jgi:beta-mannosidase
MIGRRGVACAVFWSLLASAAPAASTILLSGGDWQLASFDPGRGAAQKAFADGYPSHEAIASMVPGEVHWDLERAGRIEPICYGLNSQKIDWVAGKEWWYRKTFRVPSPWQGKIVRLEFDGVDYLADVWLNGRHLGRHEGQFTPFEFDVSAALQRDGENILAVQIHPAPESVRKMVADRKKIMSVENCRPVMQAMRAAYPCWKSMTNASWDWSAVVITMGIWKDVRLVASEAVSLDRPIVLPQLAPPYHRATLHTRLNVRADKPCAVDLCYCVRCLTAEAPEAAGTKKIELVAGLNRVAFPIELEQPQLWWPNGYGKQHLYGLELTARPAGGDKTLADTRATFGIRDLQMLENPEYVGKRIDPKTKLPVEDRLATPRSEQKYLIQINGRKIFARGGNWLSCDLLFGRPRQPVYDYLVRMAAEANYNLFRAWAGGQIEKAEFYDACDRYGIMLFQEFPNAGPRVPETDDALAVAARETREVLPLLMNHPCIVRYGGGNEWGTTAKNSRQMAQLRKICIETDPSRPFHDPDPEHDAQRHGPYWHTRRGYAAYNNERPIECTEYGPSGAASVETLRAIMPAEALWPIRPDNWHWAWHKGIKAWHEQEWLCEPLFRDVFGELPDLATTVRCSQFWQAEGLRYANQSMRRYRWHRSACASWTYNEPWPNAAQNCVVEYLGRPKMAYYYTKRAFAPLDVMAVYSSLEAPVGRPMSVELWGVNDRLEPLAGYRCRCRVTDLRGKTLAEELIPAEVPAEGNVKIGAVRWTPPAEMAGSVALVWLDLLDGSSQPVAQHLYTFGVLAPGQAAQPPLATLFRAPRATLKCQVTDRRAKPGGETEATLQVQNTGPSPALFVKADVVTSPPEPGKVPPRLDWVYFDDSYFSLPAGESRRVRVMLAPHAPKEPVIRVEAWNANETRLSVHSIP